MRVSAFAAAALLTLVPALARAENVVVDHEHVTSDFDCAGGDATVNGNHAVLTLTHCKKVSVNGNHNTITASNAAVVSVPGDHNVVTWTGTQPKVSNLGGHNTITGGAAVDADDDAAEAHVTTRKGNTVDVSGGSTTVKTRPRSAAAPAPPSRDDDDPAPFTVNANKEGLTHDCKGGDAAVNGNDNTLTFRNCEQVGVNGNGNTIEAVGSEQIDVMGNQNTVAWTGAKPRLSDLGTGNRVIQK